MTQAERAGFTDRNACLSCGCSDLKELAGGRFDEGLVGEFIAGDPWGENPAPFLQGKTWSFVGCRECGLTFHRYILSPEWSERRFAKWMTQDAIRSFERAREVPNREFNQASRHVAHVLQIEKLTRDLRGSGPVRLLDFGCGYGGFLAVCSHFGFVGCGVDRSDAKLDNNRFADVFPEISDVESRGPFHALTLFQVLEHLDEPRELMLQLKPLLVSGGILVLETPDCAGVVDIRSRRDFDRIHPLDHINGFTAGTMTDFAMRLGFKPIRKPLATVAADLDRIGKQVARRILSPALRPTTELYFRKL